MNKFIFLIPLLAMSMGMAYADPFADVQTTVIDYSNNTATIRITWADDEQASSYQIGCVSCFPHIIESTTENSIVISNVTSFPNSSLALLYGIAYDLEDEIISAKQILIDLIQ